MPTPTIAPVRKMPTKASKSTPKKSGVLATTAEERASLQMYQREDAKVLGGDALRDLGHELGMARSQLAAEPDDDRVRMEIRLIQQRRFEDDDE
jgi:hypothetical protein